MPGIHQRIEIEEKKRKAECLKESTNLSKKLLHLWSMGKLSSTGVQELAHAAHADGLQGESLVQLAGLGAFGQYPANCHRDLLRLLKQKLKETRYGGLKESPCFSIQVPALDAKEEHPETQVTCHMVLPHLLISQLWESYPTLVTDLFGLHKLKAFWDKLQPHDPRLWGVKGLKESQKIPLWLHGDGVEFSTDSLMTFTWGPTLYSPQGLKEGHSSHSMDSSFLITAWPKSATASGTWTELHQIIAWSFGCLWSGFHPDKDWKGEDLPKSLQRLARKPITPEGHQFWVFNFLGDLEYYSNHLGFPHWQRHEFCWLCNCHKQSLHKNPYDFRAQPGWALKSYQGLKESPCTQHTLFTIPGGLPEYRVSLDVLHTIDLGVAARLAGSILHCWAFPNNAKRDGSMNCAKAWADLKNAYQELGTKERFNNMVISMFTNGDKPFSQPCKLKGHAGEIRHLIPALALVAWKKAQESEAHAHMAESSHHLAKFYSIIAEEDFFMEKKKSQEASQCLRKSMIHYVWLHQHFGDGVRFTLTPKCHFLMHLAYMCQFQNPATNWTYKQESFMGYISALGHSCAHGTRACKLSESFVTKYTMAVQLRINNLI